MGTLDDLGENGDTSAVQGYEGQSGFGLASPLNDVKSNANFQCQVLKLELCVD